MANNFELGREVIFEASKAQLRMSEGAERIKYAHSHSSGYSSHLFEVALRRIGENGLADRFVDPNPDVDTLVLTESPNSDILSATLAGLERGDKNFAEDLERLQRQEFYMEGAGYANPHFRFAHGIHFRKKIDETRDIILKLGILRGRRYFEVKSEIETLREKFIRGDSTKEEELRLEGYRQFFETRGKNLLSLLDTNTYQNYVPYLFTSLQETIYAVYVNLALNNLQHANDVLNQIVDLYKKPTSDLFLPTQFNHDYDNTAVILRAHSLAGNVQASELFGQLESKLMELFEQDAFQSGAEVVRIERQVRLALALDHFGRTRNLERVREILSALSLEPKTEREEDTSSFKFGSGKSSRYNAEVCIAGLGLTGLENGKPNFFYTP